MRAYTADDHGVTDAIVTHPRAMAWLVSDLCLDDLHARYPVMCGQVECAVDDVDEWVALVPIVHHPISVSLDGTQNMTMLPIEQET